MITEKNPAPPVIAFRNVSFAYEARPVLVDVNLEIRPTDIAYIVGPNGGGKSTLLKLALGLISPTKGQVEVYGQDPRHIQHRIGYVPQHARFDPDFPVNVEDVVLMSRAGRRWFGHYGAEDRDAAIVALADVGLKDFQTRSFSGLSGGERQRVLIARALCGGPELLMLDEPMAHVDYRTSQDIHHLLHRLAERMHVILVSHHLEMVCSAARTVICVDRQVVIHPTSEVCGNMSMVHHDQTCDHGHGTCTGS